MIEILGFEGCPNVPATLALVENILASEPVSVEIRQVEVDSQDAAEAHRFLGSPSVKVNGLDVEPSRQADERYAYSCRVYRTEAGASGVPPEPYIRDAILACSSQAK